VNLLSQKSGAIVTAFARNGSDNSSFKSIRHLAAKSLTVRVTVCRLGSTSLTSIRPYSAPKKMMRKIYKLRFFSEYFPHLFL
jgi:hypothetical protein